MYRRISFIAVRCGSHEACLWRHTYWTV
jgi:hypothetical protein